MKKFIFIFILLVPFDVFAIYNGQDMFGNPFISGSKNLKDTGLNKTERGRSLFATTTIGSLPINNSLSVIEDNGEKIINIDSIKKEIRISSDYEIYFGDKKIDINSIMAKVDTLERKVDAFDGLVEKIVYFVVFIFSLVLVKRILENWET